MKHPSNSFFKTSAVIPAVIALAMASAQATTLYWDGLGDVTLGQSDNSNTAAQNWLSGGLWDNGTSSASLTPWTAGDSAIFGGSAASQTITAGTLTIGDMTFGFGAAGKGTSGTAYTLTGGTITLQTDSTFTTNTNTTISSVLNGMGGVLTKVGNGKLTLDNASNTYSGGTTINAGILDIAYKASLGTGSVTLNTGGTLQSTTVATGPLNLANSFAFNGGKLNFDNSSGTLRIGTGAGATVDIGASGGTINAGRGGNLDHRGEVYVDGQLTGSGALTVGWSSGGSASYTHLMNNTNTYSGTVTVNGTAAGKTVYLNLGAVNALQYGTVNFNLNGGTQVGLQLETPNVTTTIAGLTGTTGTVRPNEYTAALAGTYTLNVNNGTDNAFGGTLANSQYAGAILALQKSGNGKLTLSGTNTYSGGTTLSAGTLALGNTKALGATASTLTITGGSLDSSVANLVNANNNAQNWNGDFTFVGSQNLNLGTGGVTLSASRQVTVTANTLTVGGNISGSSFSLTKAGSGQLTLSGANTYSGGTSIDLGTLGLGSAGALGSTGAITMNGGALQFSTSNTTDYSSRLTMVAAKTATFDTNSQNVTFATGIGSSTSAALSKTGNGTLTLSGVNTYSGGTTISAGTLAIDGAGQINAGNYSQAITNNGTLSFNSSANQTLSGAISGTGALTKSNSGTMSLSTTNTFSGGTTVSGGILNLSGGGGASGTIRGTATVNTGGTLRLSTGDATGYNGGASSLNTINIAGGTLDVNSTLNQTLGNAVVNMTGGAITGIAGSNLDFFGGGSALNTLASATTSTISGVTLSPLRQGNATFTIAQGTTVSGIDLDVQGVIRNSPSGNATNAQFIKAGPGTLALSGTNTISNTNTNSITISAGTLMVGNGGTTGDLGSLPVTNNAKLSFNRTNSLNVTNVISGSGALNQIGSGTTTLSGTNTYTGATAITGGGLAVSSTGTINATSGISIGAGEFSYNNSTTALSQGVSFSGNTGTLSGTGTVTPTVTITSGNRQTAGSSVTSANTSATIGKQIFTTGITYNAGSIFEWNLNASNDVGIGTRGTDYDAVDTGALATTDTKAIFRVILNGTDNFDEVFWNSDRTWTNIFTGLDGSSSMNIANIFQSGVEYFNSAGLVANANTTRSFTIDGTDLKWSAVPEPAASTLAGLLLTAGLLRRRRNMQ